MASGDGEEPPGLRGHRESPHPATKPVRRRRRERPRPGRRGEDLHAGPSGRDDGRLDVGAGADRAGSGPDGGLCPEACDELGRVGRRDVAAGVEAGVAEGRDELVDIGHRTAGPAPDPRDRGWRSGGEESPLTALVRQLRGLFRRQVVHHLPDSHMNSLVRFKWALTQARPVIKAYDEKGWARLPDARRPIGDFEDFAPSVRQHRPPSLVILATDCTMASVAA